MYALDETRQVMPWHQIRPIARLLFCIVVLAGVQSANGATFARTDISPTLGQGYDSITGQLRNTCVSPQGNLQEVPVNLGEYKIEHITDTFQLSNATQVGLAFAYKAASGSANGSLSWFESRSLSTFVETFLVRGSFLRSETSRAFVFRPEFQRLRRDNPLEFRRVCGDSFVVSFRTGAAIRGTITFRTRSEEEGRQIRAEAGVQAAGSSASAEGMLRLVSSRTSTALSIQGETVGTQNAFPTDGRRLIEEASTIATIAAEHPERLTHVSFQTNDYNIFAGNINTVNAAIRQDALDKLATDFALISRALADLQYLRENTGEFGPFRLATLTAHVTALNTEQGNLFEFGRECIERNITENCQAILQRPPVHVASLRRAVEVSPLVNQLGSQFVALLRPEEFARVTGTGGWYVSELRDQEHFRPIGVGVANQLLVNGNAIDLSVPLDVGPGGQIQFQVIDCCPGDNAATANFVVRCAFLPFPEDRGNL